MMLADPDFVLVSVESFVWSGRYSILPSENSKLVDFIKTIINKIAIHDNIMV